VPALLARGARTPSRDYTEAQRLLREAVGREPLSDAALELGTLLVDLGLHDQAREVLDRSSRRRPPRRRARDAAAGARRHALGEARLANRLFRTRRASPPMTPT